MSKQKFLVILCVFLMLGIFAWAGAQQEAESQEESVSAEGLNINSNPLSDYRVRQAIAYAIDMDTIVETLLEGKAIVANSLVPNGPWKVSGLKDYSYNPEKAKELLKEADWDSSHTLEAVYYYGDQLTVDIMTAFQSYLGAVGIKMESRKLEGDLASQLWTRPEDPVDGPSAVDWDIMYAGSAALAMHEYYGKFPTGASGNSHQPGNPKLDKLIAATAATADIEEQKEAFYELQKYMNEYLFAIPLYYQQLFIYESDRLSRNGGNYGNAQYNYDWGILDWTIEPDEDGDRILYTNTAPVEFFRHPWFNPGIYMSCKVVFDRLILADGAMMPKEGMLAKDYTVADDNMSVTFDLHENVTWHDGAPFTPEDVKWSVEYALMVPTVHSVFTNTFSSLEGAEAYLDGEADHVSGIVIDGNSITFNFAELDPNMLLTFGQFPPLPKEHFEGADPLKFQQNDFWQSPIGTGPYKVDEVEMNDYTTFVANEDYFRGEPNIKQITLYPSGENDGNVIKNARAELLDYGFTKSVGDVQALEDMDHMNVRPVDIPYTRLFYVNKFPRE